MLKANVSRKISPTIVLPCAVAESKGRRSRDLSAKGYERHWGHLRAVLRVVLEEVVLAVEERNRAVCWAPAMERRGEMTLRTVGTKRESTVIWLRAEA